MSSQKLLSLKKALYQKALEVIHQRINTTKTVILNAQAAANAEQKSSAGDKYETSRSMSHIEKDMHTRQLEENKKELALLDQIDCNKIYKSAVAGSLVNCDECSFFIAAGLGKMKFNEKDIYFLSPGAPLAKQLQLKKEGDAIEFKRNNLLIRSIC